jgi:hypothetical protein
MADNEEMRMAEEDTTGKLKSQSGKECTRKSGEISVTPTRTAKGSGTVTPGDHPMSTREQQSSKKKCEEQKQTMEQYFGKGERVQPPSKGGTPIQSILLKRLTKGPGHSTEQEQPGIRADKIGEGAVAA